MREGFLASRCERYSDLRFYSTKNPWRLRCNKRGFPVYSDVKTISDLLVPLSQGTQYSLTYSGRRIIVQLTFKWFHDLSFEKARKSLKNEDGSICPDIPLATFKTVILAPFLAGDYTYTKEKLVEKIRELLETDIDLNFLLILKEEELEKLVACIRDRVDQVEEWNVEERERVNENVILTVNFRENIWFYRSFMKILRPSDG